MRGGRVGTVRVGPGVDGRSDVLSHPMARPELMCLAENLVGEESPDTVGQDAGRGCKAEAGRRVSRRVDG